MRLELLSGLKTPCYVYDVALLRRTLDAVVASQPCGSVVHYALKANSNKHLLQIIADAGLGADCVSGGEIRLALAAGISADKIVYSGVGKTDDEIRLALLQSHYIGAVGYDIAALAQRFYLFAAFNGGEIAC